MRHADWVGPLREAYQQATSYLTSVPGRPVGVRASVDDLRTALDGPLPEQPADPQAVIAALAAAIEPGPDALRDELRGLTGPAIVCAQAGNINTGATLAQLPEGVSAEPGSASCNAAQLIPLVNGARANACCACAQRNVPANHGLACPGAAFAA